jgi:hypothetical protein
MVQRDRLISSQKLFDLVIVALAALQDRGGAIPDRYIFRAARFAGVEGVSLRLGL